MKRLGYALIFCLALSAGYAQEELAPLVKPEVQETQVMFKKTIWRRIDLREKINLPFFSKNGEKREYLQKLQSTSMAGGQSMRENV